MRWCVLVIIAMAVAALGCRDRDRDTKVEDRVERRELAVAALAYQVGADERDAPIAQAQEQVRAQPDKAASYLALARAFLTRMRETGDYKLMAYAKDAINAALILAPADAESRHLEIVALFDDHRFTEAAERVRQLIARDQDDTTAHILLSDALLELGQYDAAVDALQAAMDRFPDLRVHVRTAYLRWLHGDVEGAFESMGDALSLGSVEPEAVAYCQVELGVMEWHRGRLDAAKEAIERAKALVPGYLPALTLEARVAAARGQTDEAIALMEQVVARRPNVEELTLLAEWTGTTAPARSREVLDRAESMARHDPLPLARYLARHQKEPARALQLVERALEKRATVETHAVHALALVRAGRLDDALAASDRALTLDTPDARFHLIHALILAARGDRPGAIQARDRAMALAPYADPVLARELEDVLGPASQASVVPAPDAQRGDQP